MIVFIGRNLGGKGGTQGTTDGETEETLGEGQCWEAGLFFLLLLAEKVFELLHFLLLYQI